MASFSWSTRLLRYISTHCKLVCTRQTGQTDHKNPPNMETSPMSGSCISLTTRRHTSTHTYIHTHLLSTYTNVIRHRPRLQTATSISISGLHSVSRPSHMGSVIVYMASKGGQRCWPARLQSLHFSFLAQESTLTPFLSLLFFPAFWAQSTLSRHTYVTTCRAKP